MLSWFSYLFKDNQILLDHEKKSSRAPGQTRVERTCREVAGFEPLYRKLEGNISVSGYSASTLTNYSPCLAKMAQHFNLNPILTDEDRTDFYDLRKRVLIIFVIFPVVFHHRKYS